jgi:glycosyltransferase involved in cell wall biosynthesis
MRKICHLSTAHPRSDIRVFLKECKSLSSEFDTHLVVADGSGNEEKNSVKIYDVGISKNRLTRFIFTVVRVYRKALALDCEIYHFHDPDFIIAAVFLQWKGKKVIYDIHEDVPRDIYSKDYLGVFRKPISLLFEKIENWAARKYSALITATPFIEKRFLKVNKRTWCINNFPLPSEIPASMPTAARLNRIAYTGAITRIRGISELVDSLNHVSVELELAGDFEDDSLKESLMTKLAWKKVRYHGLLKRQDMRDLLSTCLAGLVTYYPEPNHVNAQPNKIFEYMSSGLPVICSHFEAWKEIIETHNCGVLVDPMDPRSIASGIQSLVDQPDKALVMGMNGLRAVKQFYNWETEEKKLLNIYKEISN